MIIIGNLVEDEILESLLKSENIYLKLFTNNLTVNNSTLLANFTEMNSIGYVQKTLQPSSWVKHASEGGTYFEYPAQQWNFTVVNGVPATYIYGYYLVRATSGLLVASEKFYPDPEIMLYGSKNSLNLTVRVGID